MPTIIVIEGPDGCGKSALTKSLVTAIKTKFPNYSVISSREPGDNIQGLRDMILNPGLMSMPGERGIRGDYRRGVLPPRLSMGLTAASWGSSVYLAKEMESYMERPTILVSDRSVFSAYAYQALANPEVSDEKEVRSIIHDMYYVYAATADDSMIDHTIWLDGNFGAIGEDDVYSKQGESDALRNAYELMRIETTGVSKHHDLPLEIQHSSTYFTYIANQELSIDDTTKIAMESLNDTLLTAEHQYQKSL